MERCILVRFETGLKEGKTSSKPNFFKRGVTSASLNSSGKEPVESELLIILEMIGRSRSKHFFKMGVGRGSKAHDLDGALRINFLTSSSDNSLKEEKID